MLISNLSNNKSGIKKIGWLMSFLQLFSSLRTNLIGQAVAMVTRKVRMIDTTVTRYFVKQIKIKNIYSGMNSSNEHCWKQLKATSIRKRSKKSDSWEMYSFLCWQFFFIIDQVSFDLQTFAKSRLKRST